MARPARRPTASPTPPCTGRTTTAAARHRANDQALILSENFVAELARVRVVARGAGPELWRVRLRNAGGTYLRFAGHSSAPYFAPSASSSSMRSNWLYFTIRSVRHREPVLIWPAFVATAMS